MGSCENFCYQQNWVLQSFFERGTAGEQAAGGGNTQLICPGSTGERLFAKYPVQAAILK
jgi:hypothetical protein